MSHFSIETVDIIVVLQLPPKLSLRIDVNYEFLYGICDLLPVEASCNATITCSKNIRDTFIKFPSFNNLPSNPNLCTRSDPAKSTKVNLLLLTTSDPGFLALRLSINKQCDLVDASCLGVSATTLFVSPINNKFSASSSVCIK